MKKIHVIVCILLIAITVAGKEKMPTPALRTWHFSPVLITPDTLYDIPDTLVWNYPMQTVINDYSIANAYNGNLISPIQSKIYFDRRTYTDNIFVHAYTPYIIPPEKARRNSSPSTARFAARFPKSAWASARSSAKTCLTTGAKQASTTLAWR